MRHAGTGLHLGGLGEGRAKRAPAVTGSGKGNSVEGRCRSQGSIWRGSTPRHDGWRGSGPGLRNLPPNRRVGTTLVPGIFRHPLDLAIMRGVVRSVLGASAGLSLLGIRYPQKMLPLLSFEFARKSI